LVNYPPKVRLSELVNSLKVSPADDSSRSSRLSRRSGR
jgi:hypothetical protein